MYNYTLENNIIVGSLIHDGLMIEKTDKIKDFLRKCSTLYIYIQGIGLQ